MRDVNQSLVTIIGCAVGVALPGSVSIRLDYVKSASEHAAVSSGKRRPRKMAFVLSVEDAKKLAMSIQQGIDAAGKLS